MFKSDSTPEKLPNLHHYTSDELSRFFVNPSGVKGYFNRTISGTQRVVHTPWIKVNDASYEADEANALVLKKAQAILNEWLPHIDKIKSEWPGLFEFETEMAAKVGPMSVQAPLKYRLEDIQDYFTHGQVEAAPVDERAIKAVISEFADRKTVTPQSLYDTYINMKKSTSSGAPCYPAKRRELDLNSVLASSKTLTRDGIGNYRIKWEGTWYDVTAMLGWRGQEGGPKIKDEKNRTVFMFPVTVNTPELSVYQPLIADAQRIGNMPALISNQAVDLSVTNLFDTKDEKDLVVCTDFTKFDHHFNLTMQQAAYNILSGLLNTKDKDVIKWLDNVFPCKYEIPLICGGKKIFVGKHGMGSGSGGTNWDESVVHKSLQYEAALHANSRLNPYSMAHGDDGILSYHGINVEDLVKSYTDHGVEMNVSKQSASPDECIFLRRWHHRKFREGRVCVGVYPTCRALGRLLFQERMYDPEIWGPKMVALRELSIIENVKYHPLREEFADFCMKRDKYRLGLDISGFLDNIEKISREAIDLMPDFLGYNRTVMDSEVGIGDWWIVNYLRNRA